ncbi:MAG: hypothetical protein [Circular genetic element sp.]|nr:MAG: hypothetical protein [Circular genetic element sp.]
MNFKPMKYLVGSPGAEFVKAPCKNRNRTTRICRRSCCRKIPLVSNQVITRRRKYFDHSKYNSCTVCKTRIYVSSGQECLLASEGNTFDCIPSF